MQRRSSCPANNQYGLLISDNTTLNSGATFNIAAGTVVNSNGVPNLILSGIISGAGFTKSGTGTMVLSNTGNNFAGTINITNGILAVDQDSELGALTNTIILNTGTATTNVGFRATGNIDTSRTFDLNGTDNAFEVTQGNTLTLEKGLVFAAAADVLIKNDEGTLELKTAPTVGASGTWTGATTVNQGTIEMDANGVLGTGAITLANRTANLTFNGNLTVANAINLTPALNDWTNGINSQGMLYAASGNTTVTGTITMTDSAFTANGEVHQHRGVAGVANGATLTLGTINYVFDAATFTSDTYNLSSIRRHRRGHVDRSHQPKPDDRRGHPHHAAL